MVKAEKKEGNKERKEQKKHASYVEKVWQQFLSPCHFIMFIQKELARVSVSELNWGLHLVGRLKKILLPFRVEKINHPWDMLMQCGSRLRYHTIFP
jgi:hypothetical protein